MAKRVAISLDKDQLKILRIVKGFGKKDAEIAKNLILAYLSEKGYLDKYNNLGKYNKVDLNSKQAAPGAKPTSTRKISESFCRNDSSNGSRGSGHSGSKMGGKRGGKNEK